MLPDVIIQQQRPETTPGQVGITPGIRKMTPGRVKIAPGMKKTTHGQVETTPELKKMTPGRLKIAPGIKKMTHGQVKTVQGRVEYAPGPLPARHSVIFRCALTAPGYRVGRPERPEVGLIKGENKKHQISNIEYRITNNESGSFLGILVSYFLFSSFRNNEPRIRNVESGKNIPVLRTSGFNEVSLATKLVGATHLGIQTAGTAIGKTAAAPRNTLSGNRRICRNEYSSSGKKVRSTETLKENKEHRIRNNQSESILGIPVSDFLFPVRKPGRLISYFLFPDKEYIEHRKTFTGLAANPDGARSSVRVGTPGKPETISIEGKNIPVRLSADKAGCISGLNHIPFATNPSVARQVITGATHLGLQTAGTAISETAAAPRNILPNIRLICQTFINETAAAPRNICRTAGHPSGKKVRSTETLKENNEYPIRNNKCKSELKIHSEYKDAPLLPRGGFNSGDIPGAAAITSLQVLFSSPRVSPNFAGARCYALSGLEPLSAYLPTGLPVKNRPETGEFPWYCHPESRVLGRGTSTHPERLLQRTKPERRYAYVLN